jgi:hypothetical protein
MVVTWNFESLRTKKFILHSRILLAGLECFSVVTYILEECHSTDRNAHLVVGFVTTIGAPIFLLQYCVV